MFDKLRRATAANLAAMARAIDASPFDTIKLKGDWEFHLFDKDGRLKDHRKKSNIIVTTGFQLVADCLCATSGRPTVVGYIGIGTGAVAPAVGDTALGTQLVRQASSYTYTSGSKKITQTTTFAAGTGTGALTEAGMFNAASAGTMLNRVTFSTINKAAGDTLAVTFDLTMS